MPVSCPPAVDASCPNLTLDSSLAEKTSLARFRNRPVMQEHWYWYAENMEGFEFVKRVAVIKKCFN